MLLCHTKFYLLIIYIQLLCTFSFKWHLTDVLPQNSFLTFSERFMFASKHGPFIMGQGDSFINIDADVVFYMESNETRTVSYAVYATSEEFHESHLDNMCSGYPTSFYAMNIDSGIVSTHYIDHVSINNPELELNGTYYKFLTHIKKNYPVIRQAWYNVAFKLCGEKPKDNSIAQIDGYVTFKNPYGYIPGELFGFLPFEGARMIAYIVFAIYYLYFYVINKESLLPLHHAILFVFLVALIESITWYTAYQSINISGQPYCCPFPNTVVVALVLQVFRQTFARTLLLVVALGYGIVRPKLLPAEWVTISIITVVYFISAVVSQVANIIITNDVHAATEVDKAILCEVPGFIVDIIMISWIYYALGSTIRILREFQQTSKLKMYTQLSYVIALFVSLFVFFAILVILDKFGFISWPWQVAWLKYVLWEVLNFSILSAACIICIPSCNSSFSALNEEDADFH